MKNFNVFVQLIYFFSNGHKCTLGIDSYVCIVLNPIDKCGLEWCKGYSFLTIFSCERIHPLHHPNWFWACLDGMTTLHLTLVFFLSIFYLAK
jgi:hypothetical protein